MHQKGPACFWERDKLATSFSCLVDPMDSLLDRELQVEPARLSVNRSRLVLCKHLSSHLDRIMLKDSFCLAFC